MVIEDNSEMASLINILFENEGFHVLQFETAEKALEFLKSNDVNIILLDINLPGVDGFTFLSHARRVTNIPVLIITARKTDSDVITGLGYGADDFVAKPFSSDVLVARVRALLRRADGQSNNSNAEIRFGPFLFRPNISSLEKGGQPISLSNRESKVLSYLIDKGMLNDNLRKNENNFLSNTTRP